MRLYAGTICGHFVVFLLMQGFLNIDKPAGLTSHDVVARVRRSVGRGVKVGHAGTLDPAATGVLPVGLGSATRLIEYLADARKGYRAVVRLGVTTTTDDAEGAPLEQHPVPPLDAARLESVLAPLRGTIMQVPPMYSALHHGGRRLYELARAGEVVERAPRPVTIDRLEVIEFGGWDADSETGNSHSAIQDLTANIVLEVECSKGTYIRALARDIGMALGCGAHLAALRRTFVGPFTVEQTTPLVELEASPDLLQQKLLPPEIAVRDWPVVRLDPAQSQRVRNGVAIVINGTPGEWVRAHGPDGTLLALLRRVGTLWHPEKVLV